MSALSVSLNCVFRPRLHGARSARAEEVASVIFSASLENEMTGNNYPLQEARSTMIGKSYRMVSVDVSFPLPCSFLQFLRLMIAFW
jgi:hypothetical protein